jgi:hypothetical protein
MSDELATVAPAFIEMAHRIVWATAATTDTAGNPATRILHPVWKWDGSAMTGWIATSPLSLKAKHLERLPRISLTYWHPDHDTCTASPAPVGYDPSIVPGWTSPLAPGFGILRLEPVSLRVLDGSAMVGGPGRRLSWRR